MQDNQIFFQSMESRCKINQVRKKNFFSLKNLNKFFFFNSRMVFSSFNIPKIRASNANCTVLTDIRSDNSDPEIEIAFSKSYLFIALFA